MANPLPDPSTPFGSRVASRLREDHVIWLAAVDATGSPQLNPVWFYWDGEAFLVFNRPGAKRLKHIEKNPKVALHFNSDNGGADVVIFAGEAHAHTGWSADAVAAYREKYLAEIPSIGHTWESLQAEYSVALRITVTRTRGF